MITRGVSQEQKSSTLMNMNTPDVILGSSTTEVVIFKRKYDLSKIDYLVYTSSMYNSGVAGTVYLYLYVNNSLITTHSTNAGAYETNYTKADLTAVTGLVDVEIRYKVSGATVELTTKSISLSVVDS